MSTWRSRTLSRVRRALTFGCTGACDRASTIRRISAANWHDCEPLRVPVAINCAARRMRSSALDEALGGDWSPMSSRFSIRVVTNDTGRNQRCPCCRFLQARLTDNWQIFQAEKSIDAFLLNVRNELSAGWVAGLNEFHSDHADGCCQVNSCWVTMKA